jgi:hypothetical protein
VRADVAPVPRKEASMTSSARNYRTLCAPAHGMSKPRRVQWYLVSSESLSTHEPILVTHTKGNLMNSIIWLVGAIVIILFVLSYFGLR